MSESGYFRNRTLNDKVARIRSNEAPAPQDDSQVVAAAAELGFVNRDPVADPEPDIDARQPLGPVVMMTMRAPVRVARQFKQFCRTNRYSYWEGIEELLKRAGT